MKLNNWTTDKVEAIFDLGRGRVISDEEIKKNPGPYPVFSSQTENNGCFGSVNFYEFEGEYITWTTDGANAGTVFYRNGRFNCTNVCGTLKAKSSEKVDSKLFSYLISREAYKHVAVVGNNKLMNNVMGKIKVTYPIDISEQRKIASILSKVDDAIQAVKNTIEKAERLKKSLMQNLLTGKLKPDGSWRTEDEFYVDENFGKVPIGWGVKKIKDITINLDSQRKPIKAEDRKNMQGNYPYYGAAGIIDWVNDFIFDGTYILFGEDGENLLSRKLPQSFIVSGKIWVNNHAHILQEIPEIVNIHFLCYQLENKDYRSIVYGSAQPKINQNDLNKIKVLIPNQVPEQEKIVEKIKSIENILFIKQQKIQKLERLKKALMQNLLTGKVRVKL